MPRLWNVRTATDCVAVFLYLRLSLTLTHSVMCTVGRGDGEVTLAARLGVAVWALGLWVAEFWASGHRSVWPIVMPGNTTVFHRCKCNCRCTSQRRALLNSMVTPVFFDADFYYYWRVCLSVSVLPATTKVFILFIASAWTTDIFCYYYTFMQYKQNSVIIHVQKAVQPSQ